MRRVSLLRFWRRGKHAPTEEENRKRLNTEVTEIGHRGHGDVLVQPEMERWRFPLASIPPFGRGFSRHRYDHQAIPQHGCVPAEPASVSPGKIIVAPPRPSVSTCGVEVWRGGLGGAYRWPTLSSVGASLAPPCFRFHTPLIEPDVRICRIRLSEKTHAIAEAIACDAVCNF